MKAKINVKKHELSNINPFIYGNFMEFIERHISGMRAQMLENRHFADRMNSESLPEYWKISGYNNSISYFFDKGPAKTESFALKCSLDLGGYSGLSQDKIAVRKGCTYNGYVYLKQEDIEGPIEIAVGKDYGVFFIPYGECRLSGVSTEWSKYHFTFDSDTTDDNAIFNIRFKGTGTLWIDHPSLMPDDNIFGWRKDVVEYIKALKPNILRFPGGCFADTYHWKDAIGDCDFRKPRDNYFWSCVPFDYMVSHKRTPRHTRPIEPNDVGIDEFMQLCEITGSQALICVNLGSGTPQEAADWVEYCNGSCDTEYGKLRAKNGHYAPYNIKYWQIGNEMYGSHETGYSGLDGYMQGYKRFHSAMKASDPSIKFIADGFDRPWNKAILENIGTLIDYIDIHCYPDWSIDNTVNAIEEVFQNFFVQAKKVERQIAELREDIENAGMKEKIRIAVCEYNITGGGWGPTRAYLATQAAALFNACLINTFIRNADMVSICNFSNLTNAWWASCIRTNNASSHVTTCFNVLSMFSNNAGEVLLESSTDCGCMDFGPAEDGQVCKLPLLDITATLCKKDNTIVINIVNRTERCDISLATILEDYVPSGCVEVVSVSSDYMECVNDFASPERIVPSVYKTDTSVLENLLLKPCSLTMIKIGIEK